MKTDIMPYPGGKTKALTFSYDDGVLQDKRLVEIFNKYGLKATFNLNSGLLGRTDTLVRNGVRIGHTKVSKEDVKYIYDGHEVAVHTLTHPNLAEMNDDNEIIRQVEEDRQRLSELVGYEVYGMAYPGGGKNCSDEVAGSIRDNTPIKYARTTKTRKSFEPFGDLFQYEGTLYHHNEWDCLFDLGRKFLELNAFEPKVFYIWGHSYEFDIFPKRWELFEKFCEMMSNNDGIFYGTNLEVLTNRR